MKKMICMALCLSVLVTLFIGISVASAGSVTPNYSRSGITCKASVTAEKRANQYAYAEVSMKIVFARGVGLSNEGQTYTRSDKSSAWADKVNQSRTVTARVSCDNPRDEVSSKSLNGKTSWKNATD